MAITKLPPEFQTPENLSCAICHAELQHANAIAGLCDPQGRQLFMCASHLSDPEFFITAWAKFVIQERTRYLGLGIEPTGSIYEGWLCIA